MNYQTFAPHPDLSAVVKYFWTLEVPANNEVQRQRIVPDGFIELFFILGENVKRYTSGNEFIIQPRAMVLGQITEPFFIEPSGYVNSFAIRFYPHGFSHFTHIPLKNMANTETPLSLLFGEIPANDLEQKIILASSTEARIQIMEEFLLGKLMTKETIDLVVKSAVDDLFLTRGRTSILHLLKDDISGRRRLERKFVRQVGISPKQLGKVIRMQTALKLLLSQSAENLTRIAYESEYYDQAHFIRDFREFTGVNPGNFSTHEAMALSSLFLLG